MNTEKRRKHVFFLPLMFIGMGIGFLLNSFYENAFVACMFIGMGLGFLLDSFLVIEERKIKVKRVYKASSFALMFLGVVFILSGMIYFLNSSLLNLFKNYLIAIGFIALGVIIFVKGVEGWKSE